MRLVIAKLNAQTPLTCSDLYDWLSRGHVDPGVITLVTADDIRECGFFSSSVSLMGSHCVAQVDLELMATLQPLSP